MDPDLFRTRAWARFLRRFSSSTPRWYPVRAEVMSCASIVFGLRFDGNGTSIPSMPAIFLQ
jgi:hypothetical protein